MKKNHYFKISNIIMQKINLVKAEPSHVANQLLLGTGEVPLPVQYTSKVHSFPPPPMPLKNGKSIEKHSATPFPKYLHPDPEEVKLVVSLLSQLHGRPTRGEHVFPVLDSIVRTILSQNTTDKISQKAFMSLKTRFPSWRDVYEAYGSGRIEEAIKCGGLAELKAKNIHNILAYLLYEHFHRCPDGEPSYEWLRNESTAFCKAELIKHNGIGPKTISCVLMFNLMRDEFPVDTHVLHIAKMLRWVPSTASAEQSYAHLNFRVTSSLKYPLHVLLVEHGKRCPRCAKRSLQLPQEGPCPLQNLHDKLLDEAYSKRTAEPLGNQNGTTKSKRECDLGCNMLPIKTEPETPVKRRKVLQHLDMQG